MSPVLRAETANQLGRVGGREGTGSREITTNKDPQESTGWLEC